jgi:conjugative relaxase-like TrwC/TraI family protein
LNHWEKRPFFFPVITSGIIRNGSTYLSNHLRKNDYWTEGEKEVQGEWIGLSAARLGLAGPVTEKPFDALRRNRNPQTEKMLTSRSPKNRVAFIDIQLSAPKDLSVLAIVGNDDRVVAAFRESVKIALAEMERFAAVRERRGESHGTEAVRLTGNFVGALFFHDTSRDLDPQLHAHAVLANATWDPVRENWYALQPAEMLRASGYLRQALYRELAQRLHKLGYETYDMNSQGFHIRGVEHLRERFSKRSRHVQQLALDFAEKKGRHPTKREVEVLVRESRGSKLPNVSTSEVRQRQRAELSSDEMKALTHLVREAHASRPRQHLGTGETQAVLEAAIRHVFERASVVREDAVLRAALELNPEFYDWRNLRELLQVHPDAIRRGTEMTLRVIHREESATLRRVIEGRNTQFPLGAPVHLPENLTLGQKAAATALLANRDFVSALLGDAGTGKTTVLSAIERAHRGIGGKPFLPLAPTTRAREALTSAGFESAETVQRFLVSEKLQVEAAGRVILVDEAGLLSTEQLDRLTRIAREFRARLLLVGDTKQHYSVQRGDAFRNVVRHSGIPVVRLSEVLRQRGECDRHFSRLLGAGEVTEAFQYAVRREMIEETGDDHVLFATAAEHYASNLAAGIETLVVIPFWPEIEQFNPHARRALRARGLLGQTELIREAVKPLSWTEEQKVHWNQYSVGDRLLFIRATRFFEAGTAAEVQEILPDGVRVIRDNGKLTKITSRQRRAYEVGRPVILPLSAGDRILIRGSEDTQEFSNGEFKQVASVDPIKNEVQLTDGKVLPADFRAWTYGHALTSYRAQGSTAEESLLVLGEVAQQSLSRRQFYVGNTRYRGAHRIYVSNRDAILARLGEPDPGRELANEFTRRHKVDMREHIAVGPFLRMGERARRIWYGMAARWRETCESVRERMDL